MTKILVDANVLISFLTDRNVEQQKRATRLLEGAVRREHTLVLHLQVVAEVAYVLRNLYGESVRDTARLLRELAATPGISASTAIDWRRLFELWPDALPSLADAVLAAAVAAGEADAVATFDVKLARSLHRAGIPVRT